MNRTEIRLGRTIQPSSPTGSVVTWERLASEAYFSWVPLPLTNWGASFTRILYSYSADPMFISRDKAIFLFFRFLFSYRDISMSSNKWATLIIRFRNFINSFYEEIVSSQMKGRVNFLLLLTFSYRSCLDTTWCKQNCLYEMSLNLIAKENEVYSKLADNKY